MRRRRIRRRSSIKNRREKRWLERKCSILLTVPKRSWREATTAASVRSLSSVDAKVWELPTPAAMDTLMLPWLLADGASSTSTFAAPADEHFLFSSNGAFGLREKDEHAVTS